jgi:hypothetical protein
MTQTIINGNAAEWRGPRRIAVTLGTAPMHSFEYTLSMDGRWALLESYLPAAANGDPLVDAMRFEKVAGRVAQEFLRRERPRDRRTPPAGGRVRRRGQQELLPTVRS